MEDILLSDSDMNCLSISSNDFVCGWLGADGCCRAGCGPRDWTPRADADFALWWALAACA